VRGLGCSCSAGLGRGAEKKTGQQSLLAIRPKEQKSGSTSFFFLISETSFQIIFKRSFNSVEIQFKITQNRNTYAPAFN
jgi:hypothetical protein